MKLMRLALLIVVVIFCATACATPPNQTANNAPGASAASTTPTPDGFTVARAIFAKHCVVCHGEKGVGGTVTVDDHKLKVPSLREGHALDHPDSEFVAQINKGGDGMPAFNDKLRPDEINILVGFIRHEFQAGRTPPPEPAKPMSKH